MGDEAEMAALENEAECTAADEESGESSARGMEPTRGLELTRGLGLGTISTAGLEAGEASCPTPTKMQKGVAFSPTPTETHGGGES